tara:strand:- start:4553 stop:4933 length:381 start_codon:yes stop_codon:yes gene_type:complete
MSEKTKMLIKFNKTFGLPVAKKPTLLNSKEYNLKYNLLKEELDEYHQACANDDMLEISDALVDIAYVLYGMVVHHGLSNVFDDMFQEVHNSNMSKLENGKVLRRTDGKILKGSEFFKPNLKQFLDG